MSQIKITDLVSQETIDEVRNLNTEIQRLLTTYTETAKDLAKGLEINVRVVGDIDKLDKLFVEKSKEASETQEKLNNVLTRQREIILETTNVKSRMLMEQERLNKTQREAYTDTASFKSLLEQVNGSYENRVKRLVETNQAIAANKKQQDDLKKSLDMGRISQAQYNEKLVKLTITERELKQTKSDLITHMKNEEREMQSVEGSYRNLSQRLELMKKAYKDLTEEERSSPLGKEMESAIQNLDAHLKDMAADMGEFQRNVGNYAIAGQNGVVSTESLVAVMNQQAVTLQDVADQTKILEEAKRMLDTTDEHYAETLSDINARIDENKAKLTDVSDIMEKDASSAAEAEAQNKRLQEAMKHIDVTAEGAQEKIDELNEKIEKNNIVIERATPTTERLAKEQRELAEAAKKAEKEIEKEQKTNTALADQMLSLIGINNKFGSSLSSLQTSGNVVEGLNTKVMAFGKTLTGLLANPWVLAFLGIAGVVAGFKWWYDYNKGLIEASRLTKNFTGLTGDAADKVTADCQVMADKMGKGFDETIGAANTLVQQFGISWDDALQMIQDGIVAGADMSGKFVENIDKYSGAFHDAGIEADQFIAILAETRNGIFDEKALKSITDAGTRLRSMTKNTEASLNAIGISAKKMQDDLANGNITMLEAVQQVTDKMKELPPNCQEVGDVMKNVFGRKSAMAGEEVVKSISDINDNLDAAKASMGGLGKVTEEEIEAQKELQRTIAAVFKASGTSFEEMTSQAKTYMAKGLTAVIKGIIDIINWFVRLYNGSKGVRLGVQAIIGTFKNLWEAAKFVVRQVLDAFKALGLVLEGVFEINFDKIKQGFSQGLNALKVNFKNFGKAVGSNYVEGFREATTEKGDWKELSYDLKDDNSNKNGPSRVKGNIGGASEGSEGSGKSGKGSSKDAEKRAKEELKILQELEDGKIAMMKDGHEKDLAIIRQKFKKKIDEIKGNGKNENALRLQLSEQCMQEIEECELKYQKELAKINLANRLASVKEGSKDELDLKLAQLEESRAAEIEAAEKTGADVNLINAKFDKQRSAMQADYANNRVSEIEKEYATEAAIADNAYYEQLNALYANYAEELKAAGNNQKKREEIARQHEEDVARLSETYAQKRAQSSIQMLEKVLQVEDLSAEERIKLEDELAKAKIENEKAVTDAVIAENQRQVDSDKKAFEERMGKAQKWLQVASDGLNAINDLASAVFDAKIERIEAEQEANTEAGEAEQERITELVEKNVITQEEGEARKRAAEAQTAKKNEELEKKKQALKYKQAVWDKANQLAQAGINTAMSITQTAAELGFPAAIPFIAIAGAMGAIQMATILATPIPKYAKGTDYHQGGPAIVGDGGRQEVVLFNGGAWLTPDKPTLVDIPKGATVLPDILSFDDNPAGMVLTPSMPSKENPKPYNDAALLRGISELAYLLRQQIKSQQAIAYLQQYEIFKSRI